MKKKLIQIRSLIPGMYVDELICSMKDRDRIGETRNFLVLGKHEIERFNALGVRELFINPEKGLDLRNEEETQRQANNDIAKLAHMKNARNVQEPKSLEDEFYEARALSRKARSELENAIKAIQAGEQIMTDRLNPLLEEIFKSVNENKDYIVTVCRKKNKSGYELEHSVSHCALMMAFGQTLGMDKEALLELGMGGLFHDIGKIRIPDAILNKPGKLTPEELEIVKNHPQWGGELMKNSGDFSERVLAVIMEHHERPDGTGYPYRLKGSEISLFGQMASIVDVYDASTSIRSYGAATDPCVAIKLLYTGAGQLFHKELIEQFIKTVGIYPVGTLVRLESGKLGIVVKQTKSLTQPVVRIVYNLKHSSYLPPQDVDLSRVGYAPPQGGEAIRTSGKEDKVVGSESPEKWSIDPFRFIFPELASAIEVRETRD